MDKIILKDGDVTTCEKYSQEHEKELESFIAKDDFPFKDIELEFKAMGMNLKYYKKPNYTNVYVFVDDKKCGYFRFKNTTVEVLKDKLTKKLKPEHYVAYIKTYYNVMFYIADYRPILEPKEIKPPTKSHKRSNKKQSNVTYLFNKHYIKNPNSKSRKHTPCDHAFKVRGHYRHLKNGRRIWVSEYTKGVGKVKEKVFKL